MQGLRCLMRGSSSTGLRRFSAQPANFGGGYLGTGHREDSMFSTEPRILVTGACGQIGSEFVPFLRKKYGRNNVIASDIKIPDSNSPVTDGPFVYADVQNKDNMARVVLENRVEWVVHLASLLSAIGEQNPQLAIHINTRGVENVLELARHNNLRVYCPSSIAICGPTTQRENMPDEDAFRPTTIYGVTKVYAELLGEYYHNKYGVDFRSLRYPGIISSEAMPGGGTTDYAVEIYHKALRDQHYKCFLSKDTSMPMMYMPDCLKATTQLMEADESRLTRRCYNVTGMSFTPDKLAESIQKVIPEFTIEYQPDFRQEIADSWPKAMDDSIATQDWDWQPEYDMDRMTRHMLERLSELQHLDKI